MHRGYATNTNAPLLGRWCPGLQRWLKLVVGITLMLLLSFVWLKRVPERVQIDSSSREFRLCLLTRVQNYDALLVQWIEYHRQLGVEQFMLLFDGSCAHTRKILALYAALGWVTFTTINPLPSHQEMGNMLFGMARNSCEFTGQVDADEYIVLTGDQQPGQLLNYLEQNEFIRMHWWIMGSDGHETMPPGLLIENTRHGVYNEHIKTIARSARVRRWTESHYPRLKPNLDRYTDSMIPVIEHPFAHGHEQTVGPDGCQLEASNQPAVIYHFQAMPYDVWMDTTAGLNTPHVERSNAREIWLGLDLRNSSCNSPTGSLFLKTMLPRLKQEMDRRYNALAATFYSSNGTPHELAWKPSISESLCTAWRSVLVLIE